MNASKKNILKNRKGFTLMELLVVIAIIGTLAAISAPIAMRMIRNGKITEAKAQARAVKTALDAFHKDNQYIPGPDGAPVDGAAEEFDLGSGAENLVKSLIGGTPTSDNEKGVQYLELQDAKGDKGGLVRDGSDVVEGINDPWGNGYKAVINYEYGGSVDLSGVGYSEIVQGNVAIYSEGDDPADIQDDAKSW